LIQSVPLEDLLVLDIETVPSTPHFQDLPDTWKDLWVGKISKTVPENSDPAETWQERAGIMAEFGRIICITAGYFQVDNPVATGFRMKSFFGHDESAILGDFCDAVAKFAARRHNFQYTGHNVREFDMPWICRRILANRMILPATLDFSGRKPWEVNVVDTLQLWKFGDAKHYSSLHLLTELLGVPAPKSDLDGSKVAEVYYKDKDLPRIVSYCQQDVLAVANLILRFRNQPLLKNERVEIAG
jgi:hypothetical protein